MISNQSFVLICHEQLIRVSCSFYRSRQSLIYLTDSLISFLDTIIQNEEVKTMARTNTIFEGVATALITPMTEDGVNFDQFGALIDWQIESGIDILTCCN